MTTTRSAPRICADRAAIWPTPPAPQTATTSPPLRSQKSAAIQPVGIASEAKTTESSGTPSGTVNAPTSPNGTRMYSAWLPE